MDMVSATSSHGPSESFGWEEWGGRNRWRVTASIIGPVAWLSFTLLYVGFWAQGFSLFQSVVVVLVSALLLGGVMGSLWTWWAPSRGFMTK